MTLQSILKMRCLKCGRTSEVVEIKECPFCTEPEPADWEEELGKIFDKMVCEIPYCDKDDILHFISAQIILAEKRGFNEGQKYALGLDEERVKREGAKELLNRYDNDEGTPEEIVKQWDDRR